MIKLFIRNKVVELLNCLYDNLNNIMVFGLIITCCIISGILSHYTSLAYAISIGGLCFVFILFLFSIVCFFSRTIAPGISILYGRIGEWIKDNVRMAKNGIKVKKHWNDSI